MSTCQEKPNLVAVWYSDIHILNVAMVSHCKGKNSVNFQLFQVKQQGILSKQKLKYCSYILQTSNLVPVININVPSPIAGNHVSPTYHFDQPEKEG